jgi:electron transport complex protein RnfC
VPLGSFHGGIRLAGRKDAAATPIRPCSPTGDLYLALRQHPGALAAPLVAVGDPVRRGQCIALAGEAPGADLHAPCASEVIAVHAQGDGLVRLRPTEHRDSLSESMLPALDPQRASPEQLHERIAEAGIVGLGGAAFPTAAKLAVARDAVVLNGAECEPLIACDNRLLQERARAVLAGGELLRRACGARTLRIAIEEDMNAARDALLSARSDFPELVLDILPARYPQGGERQLIEALFGLEVPRDGLPRDLGVAVFNVGTAEAVWRAVADGHPLTHRLVSVAGGGVVEPVVLEAALGTPVADLVAAAGGYRPDAARLILGGPLTGRPLADDTHGLRKADNAIVVLSAAELPEPRPVMPCIRCGACGTVCPARLQPQLLWQFGLSGRDVRLSEHGLFDCIECAACDLVCPSQLPLAATFRHGKQRLREAALARSTADEARERFERRQHRLESEAAERAEQVAEQQRRSLASDAVRAALERARSKRQGPP